MAVPDYYQPIMPYLVMPDAEKFMAFIKAVFDAEEKMIFRNPDNSIMHAEFGINGGTILSKGIENGATGNQEPGERGYGRSAGFIDKWGNQWWLNWPEHG